MARDTHKAHVVLTMDGKQADKMLDNLRDKSEALRDEIRQVNNQRITTGLSGEEAKRFDTLNKELRETRRLYRELAAQTRDVTDVINKISTAPIKAIKDAIRATEASMQRLDRSTAKYAEKKKQLSLLRAELAKINEEGGKNINTFNQIGQTAKRLASYVLVYAGFNELTSGLRNLVTTSAEVSDQLADIEKTTGVTGKELRELAEDIRGIKTRTAVKDLNDLAYTAGKLGITGKKDVLGFVNAANQINVALGEDLGDEAINNIAKLNSVLGITKQLGIEKSLLATGSAINELGQSSTASEGYLVDFAQRLGGIAAQAGLSVQQLLALASASDQTGQNVEVAATAINKLVTTLLSETDQVAEAIGITSKELRDALSESTWKGLMLVFEKLSGKGGLAAIAPLMKDLGSDGARLNAVISSLTSNTDLLDEALRTSNEAFAEATSLTAETMKKEESLMGIWERIKKNITNSFQDSSIMQPLKDLAVYVYQVTGEFDEFGNRIGGAVNVVVMLGQWLVQLGVFLVKNIDIIAAATSGYVAYKTAILAAGLATKTWALITSTGMTIAKSAQAIVLLLTAGMSALTGATARSTAAMTAFRTIMIASPWGAALAALTALGTAIYTVYRRTTEAAREMAAFRKEINQNIAAEQSEATYLFTSAMKAKEGTDERRKAIEEINKKYKEYLPNLLNEKISTDELRIALEKVNTALKENIAARLKQKDIEDATRDSITTQMNLYDAIRETSNNTASMDERIIKRVKELSDTYSQMGKDAKTTYLIIAGALREEFGTLVNQSRDYWSNIHKYVSETIALRDKLKNIDIRYAPFEPKEEDKPSGNVIPEVVVTAPNLSNKETDEKRKKRLKAALAAVDAYINQEKTKLIQARVNRDKFRDEEISTEQKYNEMLEKIEFEGLEKKLAVAGLDKEKRAEIEQRFYELKLRLFNKSESDTKAYLDKLDKLYDDFDLKGVSRDQRELVRIQQKYKDAELLLEDALKKQFISQEEYEKQIEILRQKGQEAEANYYKDKGAKDAADQIKKLNQLQAEAELAASENRLNGIYTEQEYKARLLEIEIEYQNKRLAVSGLTEEQITELKRKSSDHQISILDAASRKQEQIQNRYNEIIKGSLSGLGNAFGEMFGSGEDAMKSFGESMIDMTFDVLNQLVNIWTAEMAASAVKATYKATAESYATPDSVLTFGASGAARAAVMAGLISAALAVAKAAIKAAIKGGSSKSTSASTGQRVVKTGGFSVGGYSGDGGVYEVKGFVHGGEYIIPKWMMQNPAIFNMAQTLEYIRQSKSKANPLPSKGYAEGGGVETKIPLPVTGVDREMKEILVSTRDLLSYLKTNGVFTNFNISRFNEENNRLQASIKRGSRK